MSSRTICARCAEERYVHARGLCANCFSATWREGDLALYPSRRERRDSLIEDYLVLQSRGELKKVIARQLGLKHSTLQMMLRRAHEDGDERIDYAPNHRLRTARQKA